MPLVYYLILTWIIYVGLILLGLIAFSVYLCKKLE